MRAMKAKTKHLGARSQGKFKGGKKGILLDNVAAKPKGRKGMSHANQRPAFRSQHQPSKADRALSQLTKPRPKY